MNDLVKTSIEGRRTAIFSAYNITDQSLINKIEDLFKRMSEFGESCKDSMDFETKFASSELNQEYIQLFTEIATNCKPIAVQTEERHVKSDGEYIADEVASEIRYQAREATMPMRRQMHEETLKAARNTPVIGDIMYAKQNIDLFSSLGRLGKLKKKKTEEKEEKKEKEDNKE